MFNVDELIFKWGRPNFASFCVKVKKLDWSNIHLHNTLIRVKLWPSITTEHIPGVNIGTTVWSFVPAFSYTLTYRGAFYRVILRNYFYRVILKNNFYRVGWSWETISTGWSLETISTGWSLETISTGWSSETFLQGDP